MVRIFISYRRDDSAPSAEMLFHTLRKLLGPRSVFRDIASIPLGADFGAVLRDTIAQCDVMLVLIGSRWLDARDDQGQRRLDQPEDFVRQEIARGLQANILVIPVLIDDATIPDPTALPPEIAALPQRQAAFLHTDTRQGMDVTVIVRQIQYFARRFPRNPLLRRLTGLIPIFTVFGFIFGVDPSRSDFSTLIEWLIIGLFWTLPIAIAVRAQLWQYAGRLFVPMLLYLAFGLDAIRDPVPLNLTKFGAALLLEVIFLNQFALHAPRSLEGASGATGERPKSVNLVARLWRWLVALLSALSIGATLAGGFLLAGRDINSDDPALGWAYQADQAGTYLGAAAIIAALAVLVLGARQAMARGNQSSAWGDQAVARGVGLRVILYILRLSLLILPIVLLHAVAPFFDGLAASQADYYAIDLTLGGIGYGIGALLSLIPFQPRQGA